MYDQTIANDWRVISITSTTTRQPIDKLIMDALTAKSLTRLSIPQGSIIKMALKPSADVLLSDPQLVDEITHASGVRIEYTVLNAPTTMCIKNAATVLVELYFGDK